MIHSADHSTAAAVAGPILHARGSGPAGTALTAILVGPEAWQPPALVPEGGTLVAPQQIARDFGWMVWRYDFTLPCRPEGATYALDDRSWRVQTDPDAPTLTLAYTSCNGSEAENILDPGPDRNALWSRLLAQHRQHPLTLLLQGGDQLYADGVWACHPELARWEDQAETVRLNASLSDEALRAARYFYWSHYIALWRQPALAELLAEVPSLMMWDDHDIFDGWGSHADAYQACPVWQGLYRAAREAFALFQLGRPLDPDAPPHETLSYACRYGDIAVVVPDLRSERTPRRVMNDGGWAALAQWRRALSDCRRVFVMSSVPALGPRLSWVERIMHLVPGAQRYEDDLRDQWQSRAHREEWRRFLQHWLDVMADGVEVTLLSGEIHLATRGELRGPHGMLHQLVASGIAHPAPPRSYARTLGALASLGESPLPAHPIRLRPLPGRRHLYTAERNYLLLSRDSGAWTARWETEHGGTSPALHISCDIKHINN
jgi:hypothetical protein